METALRVALSSKLNDKRLWTAGGHLEPIDLTSKKTLTQACGVFHQRAGRGETFVLGAFTES